MKRGRVQWGAVCPCPRRRARHLIEVLSDSTELYDRGEKREHYQRIASLQEVLIVSQHEPLVELWRRNDTEWTHAAFGPGSQVPLNAIDCQIDVDQLYRESKV